MKPSQLALMVLLTTTGLPAFSASIETYLSPSAPSSEVGSVPAPGPNLSPVSSASPGKRHGISLVESNGSRHRSGNVALLWYLSDEQIQELEMTGVLDLLKEHINPDYDFRNVTQEQLDLDLHRVEQILAGTTPEPGPTALVAGGLLAGLWLVRRHTTGRRLREARFVS